MVFEVFKDDWMFFSEDELKFYFINFMKCFFFWEVSVSKIRLMVCYLFMYKIF